MKISIETLPKSRTPILDECRRIVKEGLFDLDQRFEFYRDGKDEPDVIVTNIREAVKLTVHENPSTHFAKHTEFPGTLSNRRPLGQKRSGH